MPTTYILQKSSGYYFRYQLPPDIKSIIKQPELRYPLRTRSTGLARSKARLLAGSVQSTIRNIRDGLMPGISDKQLADLIRTHIRHTVDADKVRHNPSTDSLAQPVNDDSLDTQPALPRVQHSTTPAIPVQQNTAPGMLLSELMRQYFKEGEIGVMVYRKVTQRG